MKLFPQETRKRRLLAFTLVDVMVAMGVLGVVLTSLFACFSFGFDVVQSSRKNLQATQILHEKMETIRLYNWDQVNKADFIPETFHKPFGDSPTFFTGNISITDVNLSESYRTNLRRVVVSLTWTNNNLKYSRAINTYVSRYGLQNYIFEMQ
jgi:uncharacterized protein (TIGR02598 family)